MTRQQREHLSALVDGELEDALMEPTLRALEADPEMRATWERYHLMGQILREEPVRADYRRIAQGVRERLRTEAIPRSQVPRRIPKSSHSHHRYSRIALVGSAAAAAVLVAFLIPRWFPGEEPNEGMGSTLAAVTVPQQGSRWHPGGPALEQKLHWFLVNHQLRSSSVSLQGFFPYATVVGYGRGH